MRLPPNAVPSITQYYVSLRRGRGTSGYGINYLALKTLTELTSVLTDEYSPLLITCTYIYCESNVVY